MSKDLPEKIARLIDDFATLSGLTELIEHEMEKRIVARHALVKIEGILLLLARYKNAIRINKFAGSPRPVQQLDALIARLRNDYQGSVMETGRDTMVAHALQLDLLRVVETWQFLGRSMFQILGEDLAEIAAELVALDFGYKPVKHVSLDPKMQRIWRQDNFLGDPNQSRFATIYPGLGTAGIASPLPTMAQAQENAIRAVGLITFMRQTRILAEVSEEGTSLRRIFSEIMLNDLVALWELLFTSHVPNEHGAVDDCVLDYWTQQGWRGATCLQALKKRPPEGFEEWRIKIRNKYTAHIDADADFSGWDLTSWPMTADRLMNECGRIANDFARCCGMDSRSKMLCMPPTPIRGIVGLTGQEGKHWSDS